MSNILHLIDDLTLARNTVDQGMGIGFLPEGMLTDRMLPVSINDLTPKRRFPPKRVRDLLDWIATADWR